MAIDDQNAFPEDDGVPDGDGNEGGIGIWPLVLAGLIGIAAAVVVVILAFGVFDDDDDDAEFEAVTETATEEPTETPTEEPTEEPTEDATDEPTEEPPEEPTETATEPSESAVVLHFPVEEDDDVELVTVEREVDETEDLEELAVEELLDGPTDDELDDNPGMFTPIPEDTTLLSFTLEDEVATVDLSEGVLEVENEEEAALIIAMIESTLDEFDTVAQVVITVDGEEDEL